MGGDRDTAAILHARLWAGSVSQLDAAIAMGACTVVCDDSVELCEALDRQKKEEKAIVVVHLWRAL